MTTDYTRAIRKVFSKVTNVTWFEGCSICMDECHKYPCSERKEGCPASTVLISRNGKIIGWISEKGYVSKTNPSPGKRYKSKVLGLVKERDEKYHKDT